MVSLPRLIVAWHQVEPSCLAAIVQKRIRLVVEVVEGLRVVLYHALTLLPQLLESLSLIKVCVGVASLNFLEVIRRGLEREVVNQLGRIYPSSK